MSTDLKNVVFLRNESPYSQSKTSTGGTLRDIHLIQLLKENMDVELICFKSSQISGPGFYSIPEGVRITQIDRDTIPLWKKALKPLRPNVVSEFSEKIAEALKARARPSQDQLLWISKLEMAQYVPLARSLGYRVILDEHNVESNLLMSGLFSSSQNRLNPKVLPNLLVAAQTSFYESRYCKQSNLVVTTCDIDASRLSKLAPGTSVKVIPNSVDCVTYESIRSQQGKTLFFSGPLNYAPIVEGLRWFVQEVLPRLKAHFGESLPKVVVAGTHPSSDTTRFLTSAGVEVHANPDSILPFLADASIVFIPVHSGANRYKILEAMAARRAVVSTGKGAEGLILSPGYDIWLADMPDAFTSAILRLIENPQIRDELASHALKTVTSRYDWQCVRPVMKNLISSL